MSHRRAQKDAKKEWIKAHPPVLYRTGYDRIFVRTGWFIMRHARNVASRNRFRKTRWMRIKFWIADKLVGFGWWLKDRRYPPRSRRTKPC